MKTSVNVFSMENQSHLKKKNDILNQLSRFKAMCERLDINEVLKECGTDVYQKRLKKMDEKKTTKTTYCVLP